MVPDHSPLHHAERHATGRLLQCEAINTSIQIRFAQLRNDAEIRRSHMFHGRYENIYLDLPRIPELKPVVELANSYARQLLGPTPLKSGFWFNDMGPGAITTLHSHEENDELLSCVYYICAPRRSGRLLLHHDDTLTGIAPKPGLFVFFPPDLPHEVEVNDSDQTRLSVAFNFGPVEAQADDVD